MTTDQFRKLALALPGVVESAHMDHPDFRVGGRIFASLGYPDAHSGMVKLPLELQRQLIEQSPEVFRPCAGAWGRQGCTSVQLKSVPRKLLAAALRAAFDRVVAEGSKPKRRRPEA